MNKDIGVIVVDGNIAIFAVIERMFRHFNVEVDYAASWMEALDIQKTRDYKTMITNVDMPGINGQELFRKARELNPALNIVLFTGNNAEQVLKLALDPSTVSEISEVHLKPSGLGDMIMSILTKETGKIFFAGIS